MKKIKEGFKVFKENPKSNAYMFFGFYFVFFIVIIFLLRFGSRASLNGTNDIYQDNTKSEEINIDEILGNNYAYSYKVILDDKIYQYDGKKYKNRETFTYNGNSYYRDGEKYYVNNNNIWNEINNPYIMPELLDSENAFTLLDLASYESYTSYDSGKVNYNFLISTNTINKKMYNIDSDYMEEPNPIVLSVNEDNLIDKIVFNLDSYCILNRICTKSLTIELMYDEQGNIDEIEPIN